MMLSTAMVRPKSCSDRFARFAQTMFLAFYDGHGRKKNKARYGDGSPNVLQEMVRPNSSASPLWRVSRLFFMKFPFCC